MGGRILRDLPVVREAGPLARVEVGVPPGTGYVLLRFEDTPLRTAAKYITWGAIAVAVVLLAAPLLRRRGRMAPGRAE